MWTNHLFHKYNWCHVIDTVVQLYMIVGLGIRLKSMSVRSWRWTSLCLPRNPRIAARVLLNKANLSFVLMYVMTDAYGSKHFSAIFSASLLTVAFWCHPSTCEDKWIEWRLLYVNHSLVVLILLLFFMLLVDLCHGLPRTGLWGGMCYPYVKESFLTAIP